MKLTPSNLISYTGSNGASYEDVENVPMPEPTETWNPIPHGEFVQDVRDALGAAGILIGGEAYALAKGGNWMLGLLELNHSGVDMEDARIVVAIRQSLDRTFSAGFMLAQMDVACKTLSFTGDIPVVRRNTKNSRDELPLLVETAVEEMQAQFQTVQARYRQFVTTGLDDAEASLVILRAYELGAIGKTKVVDVWTEYQTPSCVELMRHPKSLYRLQNAFAFVLKGMDVFKLPKASETIYQLLCDAADQGLSTSN